MAWIQSEKGSTFPVAVLLLLALIFVSALVTIYVANQSRQLFSKQYKLQTVAQKIQDERAKLQLQEGSHHAAYKILEQAQTQLKMFVPETQSRLYLP